jgi:hypothetical protein
MESFDRKVTRRALIQKAGIALAAASLPGSAAKEVAATATVENITRSFH